MDSSIFVGNWHSKLFSMQKWKTAPRADLIKKFLRKILLYAGIDKADQSHEVFLSSGICHFQHRVKFYAEMSLKDWTEQLD